MSKDIEGLDEAIINIKKLFIKSPVIILASLIKKANKILAEAIQLCPVETGTLRRAGKVIVVKYTSYEISLEIRFDTGYAIYVHENLEAHHPVGQAKYLEIPFSAEKNYIDDALAMDIRKGLKL